MGEAGLSVERLAPSHACAEQGLCCGRAVPAGGGEPRCEDAWGRARQRPCCEEAAWPVTGSPGLGSGVR